MESLRKHLCLPLVLMVMEFVYRVEEVYQLGDLLALEYFLDKNEVKQLCDCFYCKFISARTKICVAATRDNRVDILKWMHTKGYLNMNCYKKIAQAAAQHEHLHTLEWLRDICLDENMDFNECTFMITNEAASEGHIHIVEWLCNNTKACCTVVALIFADSHGHMSMVHFLEEAIREKKLMLLRPK